MKDKLRKLTFDDVLTEVKKYIHKQENIDYIEKAYKFAEECHKEQFRKSGEPYVIHTIHVAYTLAKLKTGPKQ